MTATLQPESKPTSRRALLAGALGGIGALAATIIGGADPVRAGVDGDVVLGANNTATVTTRFSDLTNGTIVLAGESNNGVGVNGSSNSFYGVFGGSTSGIGVGGTSSTNAGVSGQSTSSYGVIGFGFGAPGVYGQSVASGQPGSLGQSNTDSTGVQGYSGAAAIPAAKPKTGVYGYAAQDSGSHGVWGESPTGSGIVGTTTSGYAGYFIGKVFSSGFYELSETVTPPAPVANRARLFIRDSAGKTQLCVRFHTGVVKVLATEP